MNERMKKKEEKRKRRLIHEALDLVLDINGIQRSSRELTGRRPTGFFCFSGHTACVQIDIHTLGWEPDDREYISEEVGILNEAQLKDFVEKIRRI